MEMRPPADTYIWLSGKILDWKYWKCWKYWNTGLEILEIVKILEYWIGNIGFWKYCIYWIEMMSPASWYIYIYDCWAKYWIGNVGFQNTGLEILDFKILDCNEWKWGYHLVHISDCAAKYWIGSIANRLENVFRSLSARKPSI